MLWKCVVMLLDTYHLVDWGQVLCFWILKYTLCLVLTRHNLYAINVWCLKGIYLGNMHVNLVCLKVVISGLPVCLLIFIPRMRWFNSCRLMCHVLGEISWFSTSLWVTVVGFIVLVSNVKLNRALSNIEMCRFLTRLLLPATSYCCWHLMVIVKYSLIIMTNWQALELLQFAVKAQSVCWIATVKTRQDIQFSDITIAPLNLL